MWFTSDNASGATPEIMAALLRANEGYERSYGADAIMDRVRTQLRDTFDAPDAAVYLVQTGTAANSLALSVFTQPWTAIFAHDQAHIVTDECGAPEFFSGGAKIVTVPGAMGKMTPQGLESALSRIGGVGVHGVQHGVLSITNLTEAGTVYTPADIAALTALAKARGMACHLDGARMANALAATGATAAEMTWKAGIDVVSFGGTKNGCLGVEAVVIFDPAKAWEFELRRKRGGHLSSKYRYLSAQMEAYLADGLWMRLARHANAMGAALSGRLADVPGASLIYPAPANMMFAEWPLGTHARAAVRGAMYYDIPAPDGREAARLVTSWSTTPEDVGRLVEALKP